MTDQHPAYGPCDYLSTACGHEQRDGAPELHGSCRARCKWCSARCRCSRHPAADDQPNISWVDQARNVARDLWAIIDHYEYEGPAVPGNLRQRILTDPALFWLRGEEQPPATWTAEDDG